MITRIFKVSRDKATNTMATDLATLFSNTQGPNRQLIETRDFYYDQPNPYLAEHAEELLASSEGLESFFFLGHTDNRTFGDFSVEEFAAHFDQAFEDQKKKLLQDKKPFKYEDKAKVKAIYIFGCEAGLANPGKNDSYAQRLANALHDRGFANAKVHAVAYEKQAPGEGMYVEVIWNAGLGNKETQHGYMNAHSLDEKTVSEISLLRHIQEHAQNEASKELAEVKIKHHYAVAKARRKALADAVPPLAFLKQAENTFIAKENYRQRKLRIAQDPEYIEREKRKRVIELITPIKDQFNQELNKKNILLRLLRDLETNFASTCDQICTVYKNEYKKLISFFGHTPQSKTLDLLEQLSQGNLPSRPGSAMKTELEPARVESGEEEEKEEKALLSPRQRSGLFPPAAAKSGGKGLDYFISEIDNLYELLENEISLLQDRMERSCFAYFLSYEINTKAQKRDCLQELKKAKSLGELQEKAKTALEDGRVKRGFHNTCTKEWWKSRTSLLLNEIIKTSQQDVKLQQGLK